MSVDYENQVIYWVNFIVSDSSYEVMETFYNGSTTILKRYPGPTSAVKTAIGEEDFYILDSTAGRIDRFKRMTGTFQQSFTVSDSPSEITVGEGEKFIFL